MKRGTKLINRKKQMKQLLSNIRIWKNRTFPDWLWDLLVGAACGAIGALTTVDWLVLVVPAVVTTWNQFLNRIFEPKDAVLRMVVPVIMYLIIILK